MDLVADLGPQSCPISSVLSTKCYGSAQMKQSRDAVIQYSPRLTYEVKITPNIA